MARKESIDDVAGGWQAIPASVVISISGPEKGKPAGLEDMDKSFEWRRWEKPAEAVEGKISISRPNVIVGVRSTVRVRQQCSLGNTLVTG